MTKLVYQFHFLAMYPQICANFIKFLFVIHSINVHQYFIKNPQKSTKFEGNDQINDQSDQIFPENQVFITLKKYQKKQIQPDNLR